MRTASGFARQLSAVGACVVLVGGCGGTRGRVVVHRTENANSQPPPGLFLPWTGAEVEKMRTRIPALRDSPWIYQPTGSPRLDAVDERPALEFEPGVSYSHALRQLYVAVVRTGELPTGTRLVAPLPAGVVLKLPRAAGAGIAIDLRAPWGYDPETRHILPPLISLPQNAQPSGQEPGRLPSTAWPPGATLPVPRLSRCMRIGPSEPYVACTPRNTADFSSVDPNIEPLALPILRLDKTTSGVLTSRP